jgi:4-amino-4-deoxychorismate lyase
MADSSSADPIVYFNGAFVAASAARLPVDDRGLLFGIGFFETFRTCASRAHHLSFHQRRLERACATAQLDLPATFLARDPAALRVVVQRLLREHGLADAVFRYTVTAGARDGAASELLTLRALPPSSPAEGVCLRVLNLARDSGEWLPRPKSLNYANAWLGAEELRRRSHEPSDEGLFLSREGGFIVETTRQNVGWIVDGVFRYPEPALGAVSGTCLEWLLDVGLPSEPRRATVDELLAADAIVVTNSVRGVTPVHLVFDAQDQPLRVGLDSRNHPLVVSLRRQWNETLDATAQS